MVEVKLREPWLVFGSVARISLDGQYKTRRDGSFEAVNLINSLVEFVAKLVAQNRKRLYCYMCSREMEIKLDKPYEVEFKYPWRLEIEGSGVVSGSLSVRSGGVKATVWVKNSFFYEEIVGDKVANILFDLSVRSKLGLTAEHLRVERIKNTLIFVDPLGDVALLIEPKRFEMNYIGLFGDIKEEKIIFDWFVDVFMEKLDSERWIKEMEEDKFVIKNENLELWYNASERVVNKIWLFWKNLIIFKSGEAIIIGDRNSKNIGVSLYVNVLEKHWENLGKEIWNFLKFLVF